MDGIASEDAEFLSTSKRDAKNAKNSTQSLCTWIAHAGFTCFSRIPMTSFAWRLSTQLKTDEKYIKTSTNTYNILQYGHGMKSHTSPSAWDIWKSFQVTGVYTGTSYRLYYMTTASHLIHHRHIASFPPRNVANFDGIFFVQGSTGLPWAQSCHLQLRLKSGHEQRESCWFGVWPHRRHDLGEVNPLEVQTSGFIGFHIHYVIVLSYQSSDFLHHVFICFLSSCCCIKSEKPS